MTTATAAPAAPVSAPAPAAPAPVTLSSAPAAPAPVTAVAPAAPPVHDWFAKAPDDWRTPFVDSVPETQRESARAIMERVPSLQVFGNNYIEAQQRIRKGLPPEDAVYLPKNATPEQVADYRKKMDVPEKFEDYQFALDQGLVLSKDDREFMNPIFAVMHQANVPNSVASTLVNEYLKLDQKNQQDIQLRDEHQRGEAELALKRVWGLDYARNMGLVEMFMVDLPEGVKDAFRGGRLADGTAILNSPEIWQFLLLKQKEINPMATVVPQGGSDGLKSLEAEIAMIESKMGTDEYVKDENMRARYRELITAREDMAKRTAR